MAIHPKFTAMIDGVLIGSPVAKALGIRLGDAEPERVVLQLPFRTDNVTHSDIVHGGVIASLIDVAGAAVSATNADPERHKGGATSSLTVSYLAPARGTGLVAEAKTVQRGGSQVVSDVSVWAEDGVLVAKALVTSRLF